MARDIRFPTSQDLSGSDAMNPDPDYSAAYAILKTDSPEGLEGLDLTFTIGRGNEICVATIEAMAPLVVGETLESLTKDVGAFWRRVTGDSQVRWLGPEKGVIHLATAAVINAVWDLYVKVEGKPPDARLLHRDAPRIAGEVRVPYRHGLVLLGRVSGGRTGRKPPGFPDHRASRSSRTERIVSSAERSCASLRSSILRTVYARPVPRSKTAACARAKAA